METDHGRTTLRLENYAVANRSTVRKLASESFYPDSMSVSKRLQMSSPISDPGRYRVNATVST